MKKYTLLAGGIFALLCGFVLSGGTAHASTQTIEISQNNHQTGPHSVNQNWVSISTSSSSSAQTHGHDNEWWDDWNKQQEDFWRTWHEEHDNHSSSHDCNCDDNKNWEWNAHTTSSCGHTSNHNW